MNPLLLLWLPIAAVVLMPAMWMLRRCKTPREDIEARNEAHRNQHRERIAGIKQHWEHF